MNALTPAGLLELADRGSRLSTNDRALLLAMAARPGATATDCARLPLGQRDALILALRVGTFGRYMEIESRCGACGERLESQLDLEVLLQSGGEPGAATVTAAFLGEGVELRLPTSEDLAAVAGLDAKEAEWALMARLVTMPAGADAQQVRRQAAALLAEADPLASVELELACPKCGARTPALFDVASCFWREIETAATRVAAEVHCLARVHGWSEQDILAMSPYRRSLYLSLVSS